MKILVFGNKLVEEDSLAVDLIKPLSKKFPRIEFKEFDPTEEIQKEGKELNIIDVAFGIKDVVLIKDPDQLYDNNSLSLHGLGVSFDLKLLKKMGMIEKVRIFAIPVGMKKEKALQGISNLIRSTLFSGND